MLTSKAFIKIWVKSLFLFSFFLFWPLTIVYGLPGWHQWPGNPPANAVDLGSIPGSRRSPGEGNGNPFQYSCLGNPMYRGAWQATVHGIAKSLKAHNWSVWAHPQALLCTQVHIFPSFMPCLFLYLCPYIIPSVYNLKELVPALISHWSFCSPLQF